MLAEAFAAGDSPIHRLDPRTRLFMALAFAAGAATESRLSVLLGLVPLAVLLAAAARLPPLGLARRFMHLNVFLAALWITLPWSLPGAPDAAVAPGIIRAFEITLKANAVLLALSALLSTLSTVELGFALERFGSPPKFTRLLYFTVRYVDVLGREFGRLRRAMEVRGFLPRANGHTLRTYGYLVGMLLVRAFDRAERIHAAMLCRGFTGVYPQLTGPRLRALDYVGYAAAIGLLAGLVWTRLPFNGG